MSKAAASKALFLSRKTLSLAVADEIASLAVQTAQRQRFPPVAVCVMDNAGQPIVTKRMDDCPPSSAGFAAMAAAKANTCINMKMSTRAYGDKYLSTTSTPDKFIRLMNQIVAQEGQAIAFPGGIVVRDMESSADGDGEIIGAVGVSGASGAEDEFIALKAVQLSSIATMVKTEPEVHDCPTAKDDEEI